MEWTFTLENINEVAKVFLQQIDKKTVLAFHGSMGVGKTTFTSALCAAKGIKEPSSSPTFSIINEYRYEENGEEKTLYHLDLYRLKDEEEAIQAGVEDCLYSGHLCIVEWPERTPELLPEDTLHIYFEALDTQTRRIKIAEN